MKEFSNLTIIFTENLLKKTTANYRYWKQKWILSWNRANRDKIKKIPLGLHLLKMRITAPILLKTMVGLISFLWSAKIKIWKILCILGNRTIAKGKLNWKNLMSWPKDLLLSASSLQGLKTVIDIHYILFFLIYQNIG